MTRSCNTHRCRGEWSCWTDWSPCSVTCGLGVETRTRECRNPGSMDTAGAGCEGSSMDQRPCEMTSCHCKLCLCKKKKYSNIFPLNSSTRLGRMVGMVVM